MREFRRERVTPTFITLMVLSLLLATFDIRASGGGVAGALRRGSQELFGPVQVVVSALVTPVADFMESLAGIAALREENARLLAELAEAQGQLASMEELQARLEVLEELYALEGETAELVRTAANVVGRVDGFDQSFRIGKGSAQGVLVGHPVIDVNGYLVGKVVEVSDHYAVVVPIIADEQAVTVAVGDQVGTLEGQAGSSQLLLQVYEATAAVEAGAEVVTASQSPNFPPGVPVGRVVEPVAPEGNALIARVAPSAEVGTLRVVLILTWPLDPTTPPMGEESTG